MSAIVLQGAAACHRDTDTGFTPASAPVAAPPTAAQPVETPTTPPPVPATTAPPASTTTAPSPAAAPSLASASADSNVTPPDAVAPWEQTCHEAMAMVGLLPPAGWTVDCEPGVPGFRGLSDPATMTLTVFVRTNEPVTETAHTYAHELGHTIDVSLLTDLQRQRWLAARGFDGVTWWPCDACEDTASGAGDFAESVAWHLLGGNTRFLSQLGPPPTGPAVDLLTAVLGR